MGLLTGKTALVTGATRGIGRAIAIKFASEGADLAITNQSSQQAAELFAEELRNTYGVKVITFTSDASDFEKAHEVVAAAHKELGHIDILVNNAGITRDTLMMRMTEQQWDEVINVNLKSAFNYTHAITPIMARQRSGSIINMTSVVGLSGNAGQCNYSASKAALVGLSKSIAKEMGARGIRSNCIAPGFIESDMTAAVPEQMRQEWAKNIPLRRSGQPEDAAGVALFLASDLSAYVTGQVISCCGGMNC
jgi:3-oxoacyl-[acyl-carrier protein] reductase